MLRRWHKVKVEEEVLYMVILPGLDIAAAREVMVVVLQVVLGVK